MAEGRPIDRKVAAPSMLQLGRRVVLALGGTSIGLMALWFWLSWHNAKEMELQRMRLAAALVAAHAGSYFDAVAAKLERLADDLVRADALRRPEAASALLERFNASHPGLVGATLLLPDGRIFASAELKPGTSSSSGFSAPSQRADFLNDLSAGRLSINRVRRGNRSNEWITPFLYTARAGDGRVRFLLQTGIRLERQQILWQKLEFAKEAVIGLLREDGYLISRYPGDLASPQPYLRKDTHRPLYRAIREAAGADHFEGISADGTQRIGVYRKLENYPLYAFMVFPKSFFVWIWWERVRNPVYLIVAVLVASGVAYWAISRRFRERMGIIQGRLARGDAGGPIPSSGVAEIDTLCEALVESREQLRRAARNREKLLLSAAEAGTYAVRIRDGVVVAANPTFLGMLEKQRDQVLGKSWNGLLLDGEFGEASREQEDIARRVLRFKGPGGEPLWLSVAEYRETIGEEALRYGLAIDVSERERLLDTVHIQSQRLRTLWQLATNRSKSDVEKIGLMLRLGLDSLDMDAVVVSEWVGDSVIIRHSANVGMFPAESAFPLDDTLCKHSLSAGSSLFCLDLAADERYREHHLVTERGIRGFASVPIRVGEAVYGALAFLRRAPLGDSFSEDDKAFMELLAAWFGQTLLAQRQREVLENMALTDSLTLLPNRRAAETRLAAELSRARRGGDLFSLAICDLDRFKLINDHYGHEVGDEVLQQVAGVMAGELRQGDWVARWGGEEFIVFLHQSDTAKALAAMERMRLAVRSHPMATRQGALDVTTSIGIGVLRAGEEDVARVLSEADGCLYEAKKSGRDCVVVSENSRRSTLWKAGVLQKALQENRVVPAYQVMVDLDGNRVVADEALARLLQPDGTPIPAGEFIEAAEGINLIHAVDQAISRQAMERCAANINQGKSAPDLAHFINLSPQFLARKELVRELIARAHRYCGACCVEFGAVKPMVFEITERQFVGDFSELARELKPLLDYGFRLALDDFGSGYSSFLYLAELPISFLKIEGWMVRNLRSSEKVRDMVQSVVLMSKRQGIVTIAECVEDGETADILRRMGVDWGQGYFFGYPECDLPASGHTAGTTDPPASVSPSSRA